SGQEVTAARLAAIHLAGQAVKGLLIARIRSRVIGVVLALVLVGGGLGAWQVFAHRASPANPSAAPPPADQTPAPRGAVPVGDGKVAQLEAPALIAGPMALIRGKVLGAAGHTVPFAAVTALVRRPFRPGEDGLRDEVVAQGQADEQASFRLRVPAHF